MQEKQYKKLDFEVALPTDGDSTGFIKADAFISRTHPIVEEKMNFVWQLQGGMMRSCFGKPRTAINDRFYLSNSMGFSHLNKHFISNKPEYQINRQLNDDPDADLQDKVKVALGDDLGSLQYLTA